MASRSFDGKDALALQGGTGVDEYYVAPPRGQWSRYRARRTGGAGKKEKAKRTLRNWSSGAGLRKKTTFPRGLRGLLEAGGKGSRKSERTTRSEAAPELGFPGCTASSGCARIRSPALGSSGASLNAGLDFPGSRRGSLRRAGAREPPGEVAEAAAQTCGSWSSSLSSGSAPSAAAAAAPGPTDMAAVLQQVLERTELNKLPKSVQNKLEKFLADQQSEIDGLKGRHEKFKVESGKDDALPALSSGPDSVAMAFSSCKLVLCTISLM